MSDSTYAMTASTYKRISTTDSKYKQLTSFSTTLCLTLKCGTTLDNFYLTMPPSSVNGHGRIATANELLFAWIK